jgi:GNAT superfamily N-acetyltransferase
MHPVDYNFMHSIASFAATSKTGAVLENRDMLLTNTGAPVAEFNQAFLKRPGYKLDRTLDRVLAYYEQAGLPFRLQFPSEYAEVGPRLEARGFTRGEPVPGMVLSPLALRELQADDLTIRQANDAAVLADFQRTAFESFGYPIELAALALTEDLMRLPHVALFVGYVGSEPTCCSLLVVTGDMAGVHWVGTREGYRKRGFGAAMTAYAAQVGAERGCRVASLQASPMGAPVYRRIGFTTVRQYLRFDFPLRAPASV